MMEPIALASAGIIWERITRDDREAREWARQAAMRHPDAEDMASLALETLEGDHRCEHGQ